MPSRPNENAFGWTDPAWRREVEAWIRRWCAVSGAIEQPHIRPWATVLCVPTTDRPVWFKACIGALAYEIPLLELLARRRPDCVPAPIAADPARGWILLEDAGTRLAELEPRAEHWLEFMATYAQFQIDVAPIADALVSAGTPDSRTAAMFADLAALLEDERNLRASPEDFVSREQVDALRSHLPRLREHATHVDSLGLPASAQHDDLHQWNVFVLRGQYLFLDWGDSCVSQPLLSLFVPLMHAREFFDGRVLERIRDAYLEPWTSYASRAELCAAASESAQLLAQVTGILKWARIYSGLAPPNRGAYDEVISDRADALLRSLCG